jgi:hypothetical protein
MKKGGLQKTIPKTNIFITDKGIKEFTKLGIDLSQINSEEL